MLDKKQKALDFQTELENITGMLDMNNKEIEKIGSVNNIPKHLKDSVMRKIQDLMCTQRILLQKMELLERDIRIMLYDDWVQ